MRSARLVVGAAAGIALVTVAARVVGFGRVAVLSRTLGTSCVGDVYQAANYVPNVVFEVVAGGALASVVVPVLAASLAAGDRAAAGRTVSALLSWALLVLTPVALLGALLAPTLMRLLLADDPTCAGAVDVGARLLVVFMPQVVLYGVAVVLAGTLQASGRFLGPALAPLLSSVVVIGTYLLYALRGRAQDVTDLGRGQELVLSVGTTLGVAVLALGLLVPLRHLGLRLRPTLRFPAGTARRVRGLAASGAAGLVAQQLALVVALRLAANADEGSVIVFTVATALFLLPWAVLAVPVATSAFPRLTAAAHEHREADYAGLASTSVRAVLVATAGSAAVLGVAALPVARLLVQGAPGVPSTGALAASTAAFAPGLVGYGLLALLTRALYARGDGRTPAVGTVVGWVTVALADLALIATFPDVDRVLLLGLGNTVGVSVAAGLLLLGLRRAAGPPALSGALRSAAAVAVAAAAAAGVGLLVPRPGPALLAVAVAAVSTGVVYASLVRLLDPVGLRGLLRA